MAPRELFIGVDVLAHVEGLGAVGVRPARSTSGLGIHPAIHVGRVAGAGAEAFVVDRAGRVDVPHHGHDLAEVDAAGGLVAQRPDDHRGISSCRTGPSAPGGPSTP